MTRVNDNFSKLAAGYLFPEIGRRVRSFMSSHPAAQVIRLGIGDVTEPLAPAITQAMQAAVAELGTHAGFRGYGPEQGYDFLLEQIVKHDYAARGCTVGMDEIFVSDGSKCDSGNLQEIFSSDARIAVTDPVYPVYVDSNVMAGRTGIQGPNGHFDGLTYLVGNERNQFVPGPPPDSVGPIDVVYLCSPNNPTGMVATRAQLTQWVQWAIAKGTTIVFDAAYEAYISDEQLPHSIYEIDGARQCAIEMRSFSKRAGFTGVRCAFMVVPKTLMGRGCNGPVSLNAMWSRRHSTKFNGVSYIVQRGAAAAYSPTGLAQTKAQIAGYMSNAALLRDKLGQAGFSVFGGQHAPYLWLRTPGGISSWEFFDQLLTRAHVVGTPGAGFGPGGEGYFRLSAFNSRSNVEQAIERILSQSWSAGPA